MSETKIVKTACGICGPCCQADAYVKDNVIAVDGAPTLSDEARRKKGRRKVYKDHVG